MRNFIILSIIVGLSRTAHCKVVEKCELAFVLTEVYNVSKWDVRRLVCVAEFESNFNTADFNDANADTSKDYGLFHINDRYWCGNDIGQNICNTTCESFQDDELTDDLACVEKIIADTKSWKDPEDGYVAWASYENRCKIQNLTEYIAECENWPPSNQTTTVHSKTMPSSLSIPSIIISNTTEYALIDAITNQPSTIITTMSSSSSSVLYTDDGNLNETLETTGKREFSSDYNSTNEAVATPTRPSSSTDSRLRWTDDDSVTSNLYKMIQNWLNYFRKLNNRGEHF